MQPAVHQGLGGGLWLLVVAQEDVGPADEDLPVPAIFTSTPGNGGRPCRAGSCRAGCKTWGRCPRTGRRPRGRQIERGEELEDLCPTGAAPLTQIRAWSKPMACLTLRKTTRSARACAPPDGRQGLALHLVAVRPRARRPSAWRRSGVRGEGSELARDARVQLLPDPRDPEEDGGPISFRFSGTFSRDSA